MDDVPTPGRLRLQPGWPLFAALVVVALALRYFPLTHPGLATSTYWLMGVAAALALFGSIVGHELAHAAVARRHGVRTRGVTLALFGGRAELERQLPTRAAEVALALAGPSANLALTGLAACALGLMPATTEAVESVIAFTGWVNALLAVVNLLPVFPLDGGRVVRALLWRPPRTLRDATTLALRVGAISCGAIVALGTLTVAGGNRALGMLGLVTGCYLYTRVRAVRTRVMGIGR